MKRILLAEDEEVLRMLVVDTLEDENYEVDEATNGEEALALFAKRDYDLVILDNMMPVFTGLEVIEKIRNDQESAVKILMLSAKSQQYEQERVVSAGADFFMAKPFSPFQLLEKIEEILHEDS